MRSKTFSIDGSGHNAICFVLLALVFGFSTLAVSPAESYGQGVRSPFGSEPEFGNLPGLGRSQHARPSGPADVKLVAGFKVDADGKTGTVEVRAEIAEGYHIYSIAQKAAPGAPKATTIRADDSDLFSITGEFEPSKDPFKKPLKGTRVLKEEHEGKLTFTAPVKFADGVDPASVAMNLNFNAQCCDVASSCVLINKDITAVYEGPIQSPIADAKFRPDEAHALLYGRIVKIEDGHESETSIQPGDKVKIELTIEPIDGYHTYAYSTDTEKRGSSTFLALQKTGGWSFGLPSTTDLPIKKEVLGSIVRQYEKPVTWTYETTVPRGFEGDANNVAGVIGFQTCTEENCDRPISLVWTAKIPVGKAIENSAVAFGSEGSIDDAITAFNEEQKLKQAATTSAGDWEGYSLAAVLPLAFVAGFILNFMPCVLPVIGLKVMSFVNQAGSNSRLVFLLNAAYCLGMIAVFMVLAFCAVRFNLGWGQQFEGLTFKITMIGVVVVFALSFFGVWEIPVPGFGGGGMDQKEGLAGAFFKGILTTLLATPCSGPMLIPAVVWATAQPPMITYLVFLALGLGMGFPYIVIGLYPRLVSALPKPGPWMETFKKTMGFVMLGTAVFLMGAIEHKYVVSVLSMLLILAVACWWFGRTSIAAPLPQRLKAWSTSGAIAAFAVWFSFFLLLPQHELDYQPFTRATFDDHLADGKTVFVDFTADW